jgi:nicotinamidase-related amidase
MRDLIESGFRVAVVKDATAAAILPGLNGYEAALVNFQMICTCFTTEEIVTDIKTSIIKNGKENKHKNLRDTNP